MGAEIHIINNRHREVVRQGNPKERYDGDDTITSNSIEGFEIIDPKDSWKSVDISVPFDIDPYKYYYLVSVIYSTGDSFNHNKGEIEYIEMYEDEDKAIATKKIIENSYKSKDKEDRYGVDILNNSGTSYRISACWVGYFESLEEVRIDRITLKPVYD